MSRIAIPADLAVSEVVRLVPEWAPVPDPRRIAAIQGTLRLRCEVAWRAGTELHQLFADRSASAGGGVR